MQIGIIGAGQLGQMLGYAARELGHSCFYLDPSEHPPAAKVGPVIQARFDDRVALTVLADKCDVRGPPCLSGGNGAIIITIAGLHAENRIFHT